MNVISLSLPLQPPMPLPQLSLDSSPWSIVSLATV